MTIYALSTGSGLAGVAIIRISGPDAANVIKSLTGTNIPRPRVATLRKINNINTSELIDEGLILWFSRASELYRRGYGRNPGSWRSFSYNCHSK